ncbi:DEAD/DEAH box helicase family protein [Roseobacter weihaiensis]|uniref:DEAD/DEAH box helicase family protein n=1 Tax=Roseobacter weihaiensis TaxID=2763262 RepID=UPI001D0AA852|nr:hypothetical protein [Roseobacter sp. H9]
MNQFIIKGLRRSVEVERSMLDIGWPLMPLPLIPTPLLMNCNDVGVGKTFVTLQEVIELTRMSDDRILIVAATIKLANQIMRDLRAAKVSVHVYHGPDREWQDVDPAERGNHRPGKPLSVVDNEPACTQYDIAHHLITGRGRKRSVCHVKTKDGVKGATCPNADTCPIYRPTLRAHQPQVLVATHPMAVLGLPTEQRARFKQLIIDEDAFGTLVAGENTERVSGALATALRDEIIEAHRRAAGRPHGRLSRDDLPSPKLITALRGVYNRAIVELRSRPNVDDRRAESKRLGTDALNNQAIWVACLYLDQLLETMRCRPDLDLVPGTRIQWRPSSRGDKLDAVLRHRAPLATHLSEVVNVALLSATASPMYGRLFSSVTQAALTPAPRPYTRFVKINGSKTTKTALKQDGRLEEIVQIIELLDQRFFPEYATDESKPGGVTSSRRRCSLISSASWTCRVGSKSCTTTARWGATTSRTRGGA